MIVEIEVVVTVDTVVVVTVVGGWCGGVTTVVTGQVVTVVLTLCLSEVSLRTDVINKRLY